MTKLFEVQEAIYARLTAELGNKVNGVFDYVPEDTKFPYVVIGRLQSTPERTKTTVGERVEVELDIWSSAKGKKETISIVNLIKDALDEELSIPGVDLIDQDITSVEVLEEINDLYHGTVVFEVLLDMEGD